MGLFGGFIGEYILYVATLKRLAAEDERFAGLKDYFNNDNVDFIIFIYLGY